MTQTTHEISTIKPVFHAYTVRDRGEGKPSAWTRIGAVFAHRNGEGYSVVLDALPVGNRIELVAPKEESAKPEESAGAVA